MIGSEMSKVLIAVITCHEFRHRADAQRTTWVPLVSGADVRFFVGTGARPQRTDEVFLDVRDDYVSLPYKVRAALRWALDHGYDYVFKTDDDVYVQPDRLLASDFRHDYVGPTGTDGQPYASGFAHWLSRAAMEQLVEADVDDWAEDRWTGVVLERAGIHVRVDSRYAIIHSLNPQNLPSGTEGPRTSNDVIAVGELEPEMMKTVHQECLRGAVDLK